MLHCSFILVTKTMGSVGQLPCETEEGGGGVQRILNSFLVALTQGLHGSKSACRAARIVLFIEDKE